jgi:hypothetical protein
MFLDDSLRLNISESVKKGGAGSGNWEAPGKPRYPHKVQPKEKPAAEEKPKPSDSWPGPPPPKAKTKWHVSSAQTDSKGRTIVPDDVALEGEELAYRLNRTSNNWDGLLEQRIHLESSKLKRDRKRVPEVKQREEEALEKYRAEQKNSENFEKRTGLSVVDAWEARHGKEWPYYKVNSNPGQPPKFVSSSYAAKAFLDEPLHEIIRKACGKKKRKKEEEVKQEGRR